MCLYYAGSYLKMQKCTWYPGITKYLCLECWYKWPAALCCCCILLHEDHWLQLGSSCSPLGKEPLGKVGFSLSQPSSATPGLSELQITARGELSTHILYDADVVALLLAHQSSGKRSPMYWCSRAEFVRRTGLSLTSGTTHQLQILHRIVKILHRISGKLTTKHYKGCSLT